VSCTLVSDIAYVVRIDTLRMTPLIVGRAKTELAGTIHLHGVFSGAINRSVSRFSCALIPHSTATPPNLCRAAATTRCTVALMTTSTVVL
jgi:hypothetical protein